MKRFLLALAVLAILAGQTVSEDLGPLAGKRVLGQLATAGSIGGGAVLEDVVWEAIVGCEADGNTLTKTGAAGWNAGAISTRGIQSGDGYAEATPTNLIGNRMFGLSFGDSSQSYTDIDFACYTAGNVVQVYEAGVFKYNAGAVLQPGDVLRVAVEAGIVIYRRNGALLYTSANSPSYPLLVDTSIQTTGANIESVVLYGLLGDNGI